MLPCCLVQTLCEVTISISCGIFCLWKNPISAMNVGQKPLTLVSMWHRYKVEFSSVISTSVGVPGSDFNIVHKNK